MNHKALLFLLFLPSIVFAGRSYEIQLELRDEFTNEAIVGAQITIDYVTDDYMITDSEGRYIYAECREKNVLISVQHKDYLGYEKKVINKNLKGDEHLIFKLFPKGEVLDLAFESIRVKMYAEIERDFGHLLDREDYGDELVECDEESDLYEHEAEFPGGSTMLKKYLVNYLFYPMEAREFGEQGQVFVQFVIDSDGSVIEVEILRGASKSLDEEALRVVSSMPKWIPEYCNGRTSRTSVRLPINFSL
ncbi:MAG: TonB family protein [Crocinitomicaceae bacterium]|jgi:TonB family protein